MTRTTWWMPLLCMWLCAPHARAAEGPERAGPRPPDSVTVGAMPQATGGGPVGAGPADARDHLQEILQRPVYRRWQLRQERADVTIPKSPLFDQAGAYWESVSKWLRDFLDAMFRPRSAPPKTPGLGAGMSGFFWAIAWLALAVFVLALVVLIIRLVKSNRNAPPSRAVLSREQVADALQQGDALALAGDQWLEEAGRLAGEKNFRAMYRALYLALLSGLHSRGKIDFNRHHTNWTYVNRYRGEEPERVVFSDLTDLFDSVWYGLHGGDGRDLRALRRQVEQLIGPGQPAPTPPAAGGAA